MYVYNLFITDLLSDEQEDIQVLKLINYVLI